MPLSRKILQYLFTTEAVYPMSLKSSLGGIKEDSFLLSPPSVLSYLVMGQEMVLGSALHELLERQAQGSLWSKLDISWGWFNSRPHKCLDMIFSTLPGLIPFTFPLMEMKQRTTYTMLWFSQNMSRWADFGSTWFILSATLEVDEYIHEFFLAF